MIPVFNTTRKPLMPCSQRRSRILMNRGSAKPYVVRGVFGIRLKKDPKTHYKQHIYVGIDPGSKREGYTVATRKRVILNLLTNTPFWVKKKMKHRREMRRARRHRNCRRRPMRSNNRGKSKRSEHRVPPSTKARWDAKLRVLKFLTRLFPIDRVIVEDIKAKTIKGKKRRWNLTFSPLEVGKKYFYNTVKSLGYKLKIFHGFDTCAHRKNRNFPKSSSKLKITWDAHNVDSHSLVEMGTEVDLKPVSPILCLSFIDWKRRQLHVFQPAKGGRRRRVGGTMVFGFRKGTTVKYKGEMCYLGGYIHTIDSKRVHRSMSLHSCLTGKRVTQHMSIREFEKIPNYYSPYRVGWAKEGFNFGREYAT